MNASDISERFVLPADVPEGYRMTSGGRVVPDLPIKESSREENTLALALTPAWVHKWKDFNSGMYFIPQTVRIPVSFIACLVTVVCLVVMVW